MQKSDTLVDTAELRKQASEARYLAAAFKDRATVSDLLSYATALERDAARWEEVVRKTGATSVASYFSAWLNIFAVRGQH
ncbi:MAG TPA: hypothetical protein VGM72_14095 [Micropepsaceae bacterium]